MGRRKGSSGRRSAVWSGQPPGSAVLKHERQDDADTNLSERRNLAHRLFAGNPSTRYIYESWSLAGSLHSHFYNGNLTPEQLRQRRVQALLLADNLERVLVTMPPGRVG